MKYLLSLAAALVLGAVLFIGCQPSDRYDPIAYARADAEAQRITQQAQLDAQWAPIRAAAWNLTGIVLLLLVPVGIATFGGVALARFRRERRADARGLLPVLWSDQGAAVAALGSFHQAANTRASIAPVPASISTHYAPAYHHRTDNRGVLDNPPVELPSVAPGLPDSVALADVLSTLAPGKLCYGMLPGNTPLVLTFGQAYHALAAGDTRTGKSNYLDATIVQLHHQHDRYPLRLLIGDFKREMAATWRRSPLVETVETDPAVIADMLVSLAHNADGILDRYAQFERIGNEQQRVIRNIADWSRVTGRPPRLTFCVIDELNALIEAAEKRAELASALKVVLQTGAGAGVYVLGGAQYLTAKVFGRDGSKQFTTRALFGAFDQTASGVVFGAGRLGDDSRALLSGAPGRGLIRTAGQALPTPFQALHCTEDDILEAVQCVRSLAPRAEHDSEQIEHRSDVGTASERDGTQIEAVLITPEKLAIARRLLEQGAGKIEVIAAVFNRKRGGSNDYRQASAAVDDLIQELRRTP